MYQRLASSEAAYDEDNKSNVAEENDSETHTKHSPRSSLHLSALVCLICTLANVVVGIGIGQYSSHSLTTPEVTHADMRNLRRPSQFIGFDSIARPSPPFPRSFDTFPILLAQVDRDDPERVFEDDMRRHMTRAGTVNPEDRRVLVDLSVCPHLSVSSFDFCTCGLWQISTIVQFRAFDYGMESCEIRLSLPASNRTSLIGASPHLPLSFYRLNSSVELDLTSLSFATRPSRLPKIADISLEYGENSTWSRVFGCKMEEVLTFELACSAESAHGDCSLEWWQDKEGNSDPGLSSRLTSFHALMDFLVLVIFMTQHATV